MELHRQGNDFLLTKRTKGLYQLPVEGEVLRLSRATRCKNDYLFPWKKPNSTHRKYEILDITDSKIDI